MKKQDISFDTKIIHSGEPDPRIEGAANVPIFQVQLLSIQAKRVMMI